MKILLIVVQVTFATAQEDNAVVETASDQILAEIQHLDGKTLNSGEHVTMHQMVVELQELLMLIVMDANGTLIGTQ